MSTGQLPPIESVSGGSHGVEAGYEQMLALAERYESQAADFVEMAGLGARVMANGDLLESSILSPGSFADAEVQVLDATTGADGLTVRAIGIEADALGVRAVVAAFKASDSLSRHAIEMLDNALGRMLLPAALVSLPALLLAGGAGYAYYSTLSPAEQAALKEQLAEDLGQLLHDHPELAQHLINGGGGLIQSLLPGIGLLDPTDGPIDQATTNDAARLLSLLLGNSTDYHVNPIDVTGGGAVDSVPGSLKDLMSQLDATNKIDQADPTLHGAIQIQQVGDKYIVYIPGTDDMSPIPQDGEHARDMETNYQLIGGLDPDFHRRDLADAIEAGAHPEWELGIQVFEDTDDQLFEGIDLLDPTKLVPEELAPVQPIGRMVLDRNPTNFFAETEQVAFHVGHLVPGIDVTDDPLVQARLFSYVDTQLTRLGGPNFNQIPVNRTHAPVNDMLRDGFHQHAVHAGVAPYRPNSLDGGCPFTAGGDLSDEQTRAFVDAARNVAGPKVRAQPATFDDHFTQPRLFWESMSPVEQEHIIRAYSFELGKCFEQDRKSTRLNSSHTDISRMPSSA